MATVEIRIRCAHLILKYYSILSVYVCQYNALCLFICLFETGYCYVTQVSLKFLIFLSLSPKCWDYVSILIYYHYGIHITFLDQKY